MPLHVGGEFSRGAVASGAVLFQRLHRDPVEIPGQLPPQDSRVRPSIPRGFRGLLPAQRPEASARLRRLLFPDHAPDLVEPGPAQLLRIERQGPDEHLVQQHPQRVDVRPGIHILGGDQRLFGAHVFRRTDHLPQLGEDRPLGQLTVERLGHTEVDDLRHRQSVLLGHQHVGRLEVAVQDRLLVRVLHAVTDLTKQIQALAHRQPLLVAVLRDRNTRDMFHHEEGAPLFRASGVEDLRDRRVLHQRQRLPLGLEAGDELLGVHAHSAFTETIQDFVGTDPFRVPLERPASNTARGGAVSWETIEANHR